MENKIALVTGGSQGIGKDIALKLAEQGKDVIITYRNNKAEANQVVFEIQKLGKEAYAYQFDLADSDGFEQFISQVSADLKTRFGKPGFDCLINNAGIGADTLISNTSADTLDLLYRVHVKGVYLLTQHILPLINDHGTIVNVSSGLTRFTTLGRSAYATMKGAVETFTKYLAKEIGPRGITANVVAPGIVETGFTQATFENDANVQMIKSITALGRTAQPKDIGGVVAFLCSDHARWITGQRIEVSGGMFL